jgi:hypothetical protein
MPNPADYLRTYTLPELERIAHAEIKKLGDRLVIPVDIDEIAENYHDIDIDVQRGLKDNHHTWGIVGRDLESENYVIIVDDTLLDSDYLRNKYRMTIAEELAHLLLHREAIEKVQNIDDFKALQNHGNWHKHERNAKWLAASILIPYEHILADVRLLYKQMVNAVGFGNPEAIKHKLCGVLAAKYEVSTSAMKYRLEKWPVDVFNKINTAMKDQLEFLD